METRHRRIFVARAVILEVCISDSEAPSLLNLYGLSVRCPRHWFFNANGKPGGSGTAVFLVPPLSAQEFDHALVASKALKLGYVRHE
ncbi:hypothetical protein NDU88_002184 [Pleurodeles waltl]|uniref:Uncharacterized protein n=1 Tax=Pleurodeles waltl TaxID=8319 RepID=A0AAV7KTG2_PLEWA|nr:hypothetical protein NDU88_002184 [Pleurodeles waltl]